MVVVGICFCYSRMSLAAVVVKGHEKPEALLSALLLRACTWTFFDILFQGWLGIFMLLLSSLVCVCACVCVWAHARARVCMCVYVR